jgi:hypothetical protein
VGSFSIWHWLIVLIIFSPFIIGIMMMGLQRKVAFRHVPSGLAKNAYVGFCWTYVFFGWIVPVVRGEIGIGVLHLVLTLVSLGLFQLVMPFLYNKQHATRLLTSGWSLADSTDADARRRLGIAG